MLREGVTNKGGGLSRCAKGSQTRAGVIALNKQTYKCTPKSTRKGAQRGRGVLCCAKGSQTRAGGYRAEETNKHIDEHLKAQERGLRKGVGVQAENESSDEKRTSTRTASERKTSETKTNECENERTKSERPQNERDKNERACKRTHEKRARAKRKQRA